MVAQLSPLRALVKVRSTVRRRTPNSMRGFGIAIGLLLALWVLAAGAGWVANPASTGIILAVVYAAWGLGWVLGPVQTGGNDFLRAEWFAMVPWNRRRLAAGLWLASCVGYGPFFTVMAAGALVVMGSRYSLGVMAVGLVAAMVLTAFMMVASRLVSEFLGAAGASRIAVEVAAFQYGLLVSGSLVGWVAVWGVVDLSASSGSSFADLVPPAVQGVLRAIPTGWAVVAVESAAAGRWVLAAGCVAGLGLLTLACFLAWSRVLERRLTGSTKPTPSRRHQRRRRRFVPSPPAAAVAQRDLRGWQRDPRRATEVRASVWGAVFTTAGIWILVPEVLPYAGVVVTVLGALGAVNVYAMDGTALWSTLLVPGAERHDVRGRQLSWWAVFGVAAVVVTVVALAGTRHWWALPSTLALLAAALGAGAGLVPYLGVRALVPETDSHRRSGNPAESGAGTEMIGVYLLMLGCVLLALVPPGLVLWWSVSTTSTALGWAAAGVGLITGGVLAWGLGELAVRRLRSHGAQLLQLMRTGPIIAHGPSPKDAGSSFTGGRALAIGVLSTAAPVLLFALGVVPSIILATGGTFWLYTLIPSLYPFRWPLQVCSIAVGAFLVFLLVGLLRQPSAGARTA